MSISPHLNEETRSGFQNYSLSFSMISEELLRKHGALVHRYEPQDFIYEENQEVEYYFQIISGKVKLNNFEGEGKEFIQHILEEGQCFGEALLFLNKKYPSNAIALCDCEILELPKAKFFSLLEEHPQYSLEINRNLAQRLYYKMLMSQNIFSKDPHVRLIVLMDYFKQIHSTGLSDPYCIPLTRQQMANLTGLRVETVIRTVKLMEKKGELQIKDHKIYY